MSLYIHISSCSCQKTAAGRQNKSFQRLKFKELFIYNKISQLALQIYVFGQTVRKICFIWVLNGEDVKTHRVMGLFGNFNLNRKKMTIGKEQLNLIQTFTIKYLPVLELTRKILNQRLKYCSFQVQETVVNMNLLLTQSQQIVQLCAFVRRGKSLELTTDNAQRTGKMKFLFKMKHVQRKIK